MAKEASITPSHRVKMESRKLGDETEYRVFYGRIDRLFPTIYGDFITLDAEKAVEKYNEFKNRIRFIGIKYETIKEERF